ncbi:hypothetical protein ACHQM5_017572 [Ranunculus cassubicifolius]
MAASSPALRSTFRTSLSRIAIQAAKSKPTPFQLPKLKPLSQRILLRSPVELSCCVDSLMPYHTATSSALLNSLISVSRRSCWLPEGIKTRIR